MRTRIHKAVIHLLWVAALFLAGTAQAQASQVKCSQSGNTVDCRIDQPTVNQHRTEYRAISFQPNDRVWVEAGGCVQTGGWGQTWKRYVNPSGDNSDRLYHGLISLPGVTGPDMARIQGFIGRWLQLPPTIGPNEAFLVLGYQDDDYSDNGYSGHDNGNPVQCAGSDGGPAWVTIKIERGGGPPLPAPFDLVATQFDPTGVPMNPKWGWEQSAPTHHPTQPHPDPGTLCAGFPYVNSSDPSLGVTFGSPPCTQQSPSVNPPSPGSLNSYLCAGAAEPGHLHGHVNWWANTFSGTLQWDDHTDWTQKGDDDYNFKLTPATESGLTTQNPQTIGLEFDSDETVDHIDRGWWNDFHNAVDSNDGKTGGPAGAMIDGHESIVIGLMGLDSEHNAYSELHPVYGMAIHLNNDPKDDQWALLVRNWGDEGYCSQDLMSIPTTTLSFFLPRPFATGGTANTDELYSNNDSTISVLTKRGGALVTVDLGDPGQFTLVHGKIHFSWILGPGSPAAVATLAGSLGTSHTSLVATQHKLEGPEATSYKLFDALPSAKKAEVQAKLRKAPQAAYTRPVRRVAVIKVGPGHKQLRPLKTRALRKAQMDKLRTSALCEAYGGTLPGVPQSVCKQ